MYYLGFDIGGSSVKAALVKGTKIISTRYERLPKDFDALVKVIVDMKNDLVGHIGAKKIDGIGFSLAGPLDKKRRKVINSCNIPFLNKKPFLKIFERKFFPCPVRIEHDVHCFLLAESRVGIAKKYKNVFYLTLGTGIGGAFMIDRKIIIGSHGSAGEIGHTIVNIAAGTKWEDIAANKLVKKELGIRFSEAKQRALSGNKKAVRVFDDLSKNVGIGIANIINSFDPEVVIISGGLAVAKKLILPGIEKSVKKYVVSQEAQKTKIIWSKLGRFGGALGAALLFESHKVTKLQS